MKYTKAQAFKILKYHTTFSDFKDLVLYRDAFYKVLEDGEIIDVAWSDKQLDCLKTMAEISPTVSELERAYKKQLAKEKKNG